MRLAVLTSHVIQYQTPLFRKLAAAGIDLTVYFCWDFGAKRTYDKQFGHAIEWDLPLLEGFPHIFLRNYSPEPSSEFFGQVNPSVVSALIRGRYDAIFMHGWNSVTNWLAFITAFIMGIPVILEGENPWNQERMKPWWKRALKAPLLQILFRGVSAVCYLGHENRIFYKRYGVPARKLFFTPYAVDNERFMKEAEALKGERKKIRASLGVPEKGFAVLFTGKLIPKKRPGDLLHAFEKAARSRPDTHLFFVGDGELRKELEEYVRENGVPHVHFEGFRNQTELARYYTAADVFVLPSGLGETWGLVVNEAMCFGLPVIVSDVVGCAPDLVRDGENGFVFPMGDIQMLADKLEAVMCDEKKREQFRAASRRIIAGYSHGEDVRGIKEALRSLYDQHIKDF